MKRFSLTFLTALMLTWCAAAQSGTTAQSQTGAAASSSTNVNADKSGATAQNETSIAAGTTLNAELTKPIDSRKAKEGDEVTAKTTATMKAEGERPIPRGTKLIGHVTKASARANGDSDSALGIIFDRAEVAKGREVPIHAVVQALAAPSTSAMAMNEEPVNPTPDRTPAAGNTTGNGGLVGGTVAGVGKTVDNTVNASGNAAQQVGAGAGSAVGSAPGTVNSTVGAATATLGSSSQGVVGMSGYTLKATAATATQGSIIASTGKSVKLDSGTQMVLRVVGD